MKRLLFTVIVLLVATAGIKAQDYTFKVLANKGLNEMKSGGSWQNIKTGASLNSGDEIKVVENAYLGLVHASGKPMELKQAGTYKIADLASKMDNGTSVINKYTSFILSSNSAEAKKNRLSATGAVHRGDSEPISLFLPENQNSGIYGSIVILNWETKTSGPYIVELQDIFEEVLAKYETNDMFYQIDLKDPKLAGKEINAIMVRISSKTDSKGVSGVKMIKRLSPDEEKKVSVEIQEMGSMLNEDSAINKFFLAKFYEKNNLIVNAITAYQQAIRMEPAYQEEYDDFLISKGLKRAKQ